MTDPRMTPTNDAPVTVEQIKPCPKCKGMGELRHSSDGEAEWVRCSSCGHEAAVYLNAAKAIAAWNTPSLAALASAPAEPVHDRHKFASVPAGKDVEIDGFILFYQPPCGKWYVHSHKIYLTEADAQAAAKRFLTPDTPLMVRAFASLASAPAGGGVEGGYREALEGIANLRIANDFGWHGGPTVAAYARAALARPRAAVGEREANLEAALHRAAANFTLTPRSNRDGAVDKHIEAARDEIRLALQSPPAKVEG